MMIIVEILTYIPTILIIRNLNFKIFAGGLLRGK